MKEGLKTNPLNAHRTGARYGAGIYFTDCFSKSECYTDNAKKVILLCEVALGKKYNIENDTDYNSYFTLSNDKKNDYNSVVAQGSHFPNPKKNVVIANGMIMPSGEHIVQQRTDKTRLGVFSEYVVKKNSQVKVRYMVVF